MNPDTAISIQAVGKSYVLYDHPEDRLKHTLFWRFGRHYGRLFWALQNISLEIARGESFGVIGKNGSGKSTLLQILAGILTPTQGQVQVSGRVSALLELGSGFNPEYTGRENVFLNGSILGISPDEMRERFDQIAAFADIGDFIDQPVKLYSSGMFVRLAFAVAAGVDAEILLIDEALAVGDIFFRQKCYQRLDALRKKGTTILLVSHGMNEVEQFCDRALLLHNGTTEFLGSAIEAVKRYYLVEQLGRQPAPGGARKSTPTPPSPALEGEAFWPAPDAFLDLSGRQQVSNGWARFTAVAVCNPAGQPAAVFEQGETASFFFEVAVTRDIEVPTGGIEFINEKGVIVHGTNTLLSGAPVPMQVHSGTHLRFRCDVTLNIAVGEYTFSIGSATLSQADYELRGTFPHPELDARTLVMTIFPQVGQFTVVFRTHGQPVQLLHHGIAHLPGRLTVAVKPTENES